MARLALFLTFELRVVVEVLMVECKYSECEFDKKMGEMAESMRRYQGDITASIKELKEEMRSSIRDVDKRHTTRMDRVEDSMRSEVQRIEMANVARLDKHTLATHTQFLCIEQSLGEIKGAMGIKADKDEVSKAHDDVTQSIGRTRNSIMRSVEGKVSRYDSFSKKILFAIITLLSGGLLLTISLLVKGCL